MQHGQDGWELWKYEWDEKTGEGSFVYKRKLEDGTIDRQSTVRAQPLWPGHVGYGYHKRMNSLRAS